MIGLANKANSVEANQKILELQKRLSDVQQTFTELVEKNQNLREENRKLQGEIDAESMYPFRESVRWKKSSDPFGDDGPFCPICFANGKILMPLRFLNRTTGSNSLTFKCTEGHLLGVGMNRN